MSSLLSHIPKFIKSNPSLDSVSETISNRVNNMGDALEIYIKETIAGVIEETDSCKKTIALNKEFSWLGNTNNIPDAILRNGDAIEIKKVESINATIALNSSHPKDKLYSDDTRIKRDAIHCEDTSWEEKNLYYAIGHCPKGSNKIANLFFIDGECYSAGRNVYQSMANRISAAAREAEGVEFAETNELANVRKVDPLGITTLRIRGMWHIETPYKLFPDLLKNNNEKFNLGFLAKVEKYKILHEDIKQEIERDAELSYIKINDPNNPAKLIDAVYISYEA